MEYYPLMRSNSVFHEHKTKSDEPILYIYILAINFQNVTITISLTSYEFFSPLFSHEWQNILRSFVQFVSSHEYCCLLMTHESYHFTKNYLLFIDIMMFLENLVSVAFKWFYIIYIIHIIMKHGVVILPKHIYIN